MIGVSLGLGVGIKYNTGRVSFTKYTPPTYLSCFGTGIWENEGYWLGKDTWKNSSSEPPFLRTGIWNDEGKFRFSDKLSFGMSFLPTGIFRFNDIYRFEDKIKVESEKAESVSVSKSYWNF